MRILLDVQVPNETFNAAVRDGTAGSKMQRILEELEPEAAYFTEREGQRSFTLVVDLEDPSRIPSIAEPLFLTFDAEVHFRVVMTPDDLARAGLEELGEKWG